jgi:hypothetical protein
MSSLYHSGRINNGVKMKIYIKHGLLILPLVLTVTPVHSAYKCVDEKGNVTYQTKACPSDASQTKTKVASKQSTEPEKSASKQEEFTSDQSMNDIQAMPVRSKLSSAISALTPIRLMITDYYSTNGAWPTQLSDLGFDQDNMSSSTVDSVKIGANGEFLAELNSTFGDQKLLVFSPQSVMGGTGVEWKCYANFTSELLTVAGHPICESSANPEISAVAPRAHTDTDNSNKGFLRPGEKRMLEKYEERGRKLKEAKNRSAEEHRRRKEEEEEQKEKATSSPPPIENRQPYKDNIPYMYER